LVLCCLGVIPGIIYYFVFAPFHKVTISLSGAKNVDVTASGNTDKAKADAREFLSHVA